MKKFFYVMAATAVLTTNPLMAMDEANPFIPESTPTITAKKLSEWVNNPDKNINRVCYKHLSNQWIMIDIGSYASSFLPSNGPGDEYLPLNAFSRDIDQPWGLKLHPTQEIVFPFYNDASDEREMGKPFFIAPFPGYEEVASISQGSRFCKVTLVTPDYIADEESLECYRRSDILEEPGR